MSVCVVCVTGVVSMELAHSLLLNEEALAHVTEAKRAVFIFEWLRFLDKVLIAANKVKDHEETHAFASK